MKVNEILIKPILTEKATRLANNKVYSFEVNLKANKNQIKETVEKLFGVKVAKVHVVSRLGKWRRVGKKMSPKKIADKKKAYIYLKEGKIDLFPQT